MLAAALALFPVVEEETPVRIVAAGVEGHEVVWRLDGELVATTEDRQPATLRLAPGAHTLMAESNATAWSALARPDPDGAGARYVEGWVAHAVPERPPQEAPPAAAEAPVQQARPAGLPYWPSVVAGGVLAAVVLLVPKQP